MSFSLDQREAAELEGRGVILRDETIRQFFGPDNGTCASLTSHGAPE